MDSGRTEGYDHPIEAGGFWVADAIHFDSTDIDTDLHQGVADAIQDHPYNKHIVGSIDNFSERMCMCSVQMVR